MRLRNSVLVFFIAAYGISWMLWLPLLLKPNWPEVVMTTFFILGGFGPMVAAYLVSVKAHGKDGKRDFWNRLLLVKLPWFNLVAAVVVPIGIFLIAYGIYRVMGGTPAYATDTPTVFIYPVLLLYVMILGGGLEEPGWRGFALPRLQSIMSPFVASLVLGLMWVFWHTPLFFIEGLSQTSFDFTWYLLNGLGLSILFTIFFNHTKGSVFIAVLLHGGINAPSAWFPLDGTVETFLGTMPAHFPITIATWLVVLVLAVVFNARLNTKRPFELMKDAPT